MLALAASALLTLPPVVANIRDGIPFNSPSNILIADEWFYFARIHEVLDGYPLIGNAYLWEHKAKPPSPVFLGEYLAAEPLKWLGIGVVAGGVLYDAIFPAIHVLLLYACLFAICSLRWLSFLGALFIVGGFSLSDLSRVVSPQLNFLFWLSEFLLLFLLVSKFEAGGAKQRRLLIALAAFNFGLLFSLYTYYAVFYLAFLGIAASLFAARRMFREATTFAMIAVGGLIAAIPYFALMARAFQLPEYAETLWRVGMIATRFPSGIAIVIPGAFMLGFMAFLVRRRVLGWDRAAILFASGVLAAMVSVNQHIITGKNLEFSSHFFMPAIYWFAFTGAWIALGIMARAGDLRKPIAAALMIAVAAFVLFERRDFAPLTGGSLAYAERNRGQELMTWLSRNTERDDVVYAPSVASEIPIYTQANVYFSNAARFSFIPTEELMDRFILSHYFEPIDRDFVVANLRSVYGVGFIDEALHTQQENRVRRVLGLAPKPVVMIPEDLVERVMARARELRRADFERELKRYRVDYLVWDARASARDPFVRLAFAEPVGEVGTFKIYRVR